MTRFALRWVVLLAAVLCPPAAAAPPEAVADSPRDLTITYVARVDGLPASAHDVQVWVPLARTWDGQEVLERQVRAPAPYTITQDPDYGNDILYLSLAPSTSEPIEVTVDYRVRLGLEGTPSRPMTAEELAQSLKASGLVIIDEEVQQRARQATAGRASLMERARGIYDSVIRHMAYDKTAPGWGRGDTRRACLLGKGNCTDFHSLFISMARAEQIPARFKIGFVIPPESSGTVAGYHCWAEFHDREGWVPVDASEAWKHPELADFYFGTPVPSRFLISVGRDLRLVPPQQGELVNIFLAPYVEVNGQVFAQVTAECRFATLQEQEGV